MEEGEDDSDAVVVRQELFPCEVCGRTFAAQPLQKHRKVCEKNAAKKRRIFDSLKQRVEGTDLAPFHQKSYLKKLPQEPSNITPAEPNKSKWKEKHLEFVQAIRAAKGVSANTTMSAKRSTTSLTASPASERCPSCDRHFGLKAFDRHVEWCKERKSRIHKSPASVLIAKERLEARIKYKVPPLKPRRALTREKYACSPDAGASVRSAASTVGLDRRSPAGLKKGSKSVVDVKKSSVGEGRREKSPPAKKMEAAAAEPTNKGYCKRKPPHPVQLKLNKVSVNNEVQGMFVCPLKFEDKVLEEEEKKMITWKDMLSQKKGEQDKEMEVKEKKKVRKFEKPVVTEEFLEDLKISNSLLKGPRARTDVLLAKYRINDEPLKSKSEKDLSKGKEIESKQTDALLQRKLSEKNTGNLNKAKSDIVLASLKNENKEELSDLIDLNNEIEKIEICSKCSELEEQEKLTSAERKNEIEYLQNDDDDFIPLTRKKTVNLADELGTFECDEEEKSVDEYIDCILEKTLNNSEELKNCKIAADFIVAEEINETTLRDGRTYRTSEHFLSEETFMVKDPLKSNDNLNQREEESKLETQEEFERYRFDDSLIPPPVILEENNVKNKQNESDFEPGSPYLLEPPPCFQNDDTVEEKDSKAELIEKLINALGEESLSELQPAAAGDHVRFDQTFSQNFEKLYAIYQKMVPEHKNEYENLVRPPSRASENVGESFDKFNSKILDESGIQQGKLETIKSEDEGSLPKFNSNATITSVDGQKVVKKSVSIEKFRSETLDDFEQHLSEEDDLISPRFLVETSHYNEELFKTKNAFNLVQGRKQTNTILEPRDWYSDDLESLTGAENKWTEALSIERLNKGSLKSSHSDVCMVKNYESVKTKKLIVNVPSVLEKRDSASAPPLISVSINEPVPQKRRKIEHIESSLCANIDVIKQKKQKEQWELNQQYQEECVKKDEKKKKRKKNTASECDIEVTPRFKELLNFLSLNSERNEDEVLTLSRKDCIKLLHLDSKALNNKIKLPPISSPGIRVSNKETKMKRSGIKLPPLNVKGCRGKRAVNPLMVVGENFDSDNTSDYNPFVSAERQLMELLQCDDFKPFTPQPINRPHTTDTNYINNNTSTNNKKTIKSADVIEKRTSVIEPPSQFEDQLTALNDNFELIESFISDNFSSFTANNEKNLLLNNRRKYSDDLSSIDPQLINENDDLSIPDHFKSDFSDTDPYSLQYDKNISAFEPIVPKTEIIHDLKRSVSLLQPNNKETSVDFGAPRLHKPKTALSKVNSFRKKQGTTAVKSTGSVVTSSISKGGTAGDKGKKSMPVMKRSLSMADPMRKPRNIKNKEEAQDYLGGKVKNGRISPEKEVSLSPTSNPFTIDDEMYEEYRKYEEMYLQEKQQKLKNQQKTSDVSNEDDDVLGNIGKVNNDSAYSSLKTSKARARATKLSPLHPQKLNGIESPSSSGSEMSPSSPCPPKSPQRMSRFCHECGTKYPLSYAKFCIECGVKRLVL